MRALFLAGHHTIYVIPIVGGGFNEWGCASPPPQTNPATTKTKTDAQTKIHDHVAKEMNQIDDFIALTVQVHPNSLFISKCMQSLV